jgi:dipeptidyl-peptidase-4
MRSLRWIVLLLPLSLAAQDRLKSIPGYEQAQRIAREGPLAVAGGAPHVAWLDDSDGFEYERDGRHFRFDVKARRSLSVAGSSTPRSRPTAGAGLTTASATSGSAMPTEATLAR